MCLVWQIHYLGHYKVNKSYRTMWPLLISLCPLAGGMMVKVISELSKVSTIVVFPLRFLNLHDWV